MKVSVRFFVLLFCCFSFAGIAKQGSPLTQSTPTPGGSAGAPGADRRITLDVVVTGRSGKPVPGLQQEDFTLLDNKQPQPIVDFRAADGSNRAADPPLQSIVIFDSLNAPFEYVSYQGEQLKGYLQRGGGELPLRTSLVFLTDTLTGQSAVTQDGNTLVEAMNAKGVGLRSIRRSAGFTARWNAQTFLPALWTNSLLMSQPSRAENWWSGSARVGPSLPVPMCN